MGNLSKDTFLLAMVLKLYKRQGENKSIRLQNICPTEDSTLKSRVVTHLISLNIDTLMKIVLDNVSQRYSDLENINLIRKLTNYILFIVILTYGIPSTVLTKVKSSK